MSVFSDSERGTSTTQKEDIHDTKGDILSVKGDTGVPPTVINVLTVKETLGSELPTWFQVLSEIQGFERALDECEKWLASEGITSDAAKKLAYSLQDWLSHQTGKALRGDPWLRFKNWAVRETPKQSSTPSMSTPDKYVAAQADAKRRD